MEANWLPSATEIAEVASAMAKKLAAAGTITPPFGIVQPGAGGRPAVAGIFRRPL